MASQSRRRLRRSNSVFAAAIEALESRLLLAGQNGVVPDGVPVANTTTLLHAPSTSVYGSPVNLAAAVNSPGNTVNVGSVTFKSGATVLGSGPVVNGVASLTTSALPSGKDVIEADYSGGTNFAPSISNTSTDTVELLVTTTNDDKISPGSAGSLSLRGAINFADSASGPQFIGFDTDNVFATPQTILLTIGQLEITNDITIDGPSVGVTINGNAEFRVFDVDADETVSMDHLTITGGAVTGNGGGILTGSGSSLTLTNSLIDFNGAQGKLGSGNGFGGGIDAAGTLTIADCLFESNSASIDGGAIEQDGTMSLVNSTFEGNAAVVGGGAIDNETRATITNCTITGNSASTGAGIFVNAGGVLTLNNTIISNISEGHDLTGGTATGSNNLIADGSSSNTAGLTNTVTGDPGLNALGSNGGPTQTFSLKPSSHAFDAGSDSLAVDGNSKALTTDQRGSGFARISGAKVDIGAYEEQIPSITGISSITANGTYGPTSVITLTVTFDQAVTVTGTPQLALNSGGTASYSSGSNSNTLTFTYTVGAGQNANPLDEASSTALTLNGGTINNTDGFVAILTLPAPGSAGSLSVNKSIAVSTVAPGVANISSTVANGTYGVAAVIPITIQFSKAVVVTGTPQLALNSGGTASYSSGSGTNTLTFTYTVGAGQTANPLDATSVTALTLNGGTIFDTVTNPNAANLSLPAPGSSGSLSANKSIRIAQAETPSLVVTTTSDVVDQFDGLTSLREAVDYANTFPAQQVVSFDPSLAGKTIKLGIDGDDTYGPSALAITGQVIIQGLDGNSGVTIARNTTAAPNRLRLFYVAPGGRLALQQLTISGGLAAGGNSSGGGGGAGMGGAIMDAGTLSIFGCTFQNNQATGGSGIASNDGGGGGGMGGDASNDNGGPPNAGTTTVDFDGGLGGGGASTGAHMIHGGDGGFGGGGGRAFDASAGNGGFGGGGAAGSNGSAGNGGFGGGAGNTSEQGGGGAGLGGAIFSNGGTVKVINSTFTANTVKGGTGANPGQGLGGAIFNRDGTLTITNSTMSADIADQGGLEVYALGDGDHSGGDPITSSAASTVINNSILAQAIDPNADEVNPDFFLNSIHGGSGQVTANNDLFNGTNGIGQPGMITADPMLNALANNGGPTFTMALKPGSPAIDKGSNTFAKAGEPLAFDQRGDGFARVMGSSVDIGAFEVQVPAVVTSVGSTTAHGTFGVGGNVTIIVNFNEAVNVTGTPQLALNSGGTASYVSGSGTNSLTFSYTVGAGQNSSDLDEASTSALTLNGGTINDTAGKAATLTLPAPGAAGSLGANESIIIDTVAPTVVSITPSTDTDAVGTQMSYTIVFSKPIVTADQTDFDNTGTAPISTDGLTGQGTNTLTIFVIPSDAGTIILEMNSTADIEDAAGNKLVVPVVDTHTVTVPSPNSAPTDIELSPNSIPENSGPGALVGTLSDTDPDANDTADYELVSGPGSSGNFVFAIVGDQLFAKTSFNYELTKSFSILVQVTDSGGLSFTKPLTVNVLNVNEAPTASNDSASTTPDKAVTINVLSNDTDPDGNTLSLLSNTKPSNGTVSISNNKYIYTPNTGFHGVDTFTYTVSDGHGLTDKATVTITVGSGVGVGKDPVDSSITDLDIVGTSSADNIKIVYGGSQGKVQVFFGSTNEGTFNFTGRILVFGQGGNDTITVDSKITRTAIIWGDAGNDSITGGGGNDVLLGGSGDDKLNGGDGRDILFGDDGRDSLNGGTGDDILIAGNASAEGNLSAIAAWNKEWSRTDKNYATRVTDITTGKGYASGFPLSSKTVNSSATLPDTLTGSSGQDLFYANTTMAGGAGDLITDRVKTGSSAETLIGVTS